MFYLNRINAKYFVGIVSSLVAKAKVSKVGMVLKAR